MFDKTKKILIDRGLWVFLIILLVALFNFWPVLFGGKIFSYPEDALGWHYPFFYTFKQGLENQSGFSFPLWTSGYLGGFPFFLTQSGIFGPLIFLAFKFFDYLTAYHWVVLACFVFGAFLMFIFARSMLLSRPAALTAALIYAFSGMHIYWGTILSWSNSIFILPLLFWALFKISQRKNAFIFISAGALLLGWLSGTTQLIFYTGVLGFIFSLFLDIENYNKGTNWFRNLSVTKGFLISVIISVIFASFWILPVVQFSNLTLRAGGLTGQSNILAGGGWNLHHLLNFLYPNLFVPGLPVINFFAPSHPGTSLYLGFFSLLLVLIFFMIKKKPRVINFCAVMAILLLLVSVEKSPFCFLIQKLPIFNFFQPGGMWLPMGGFFLAILAGYALDNMDKIREKISFKRFVKILKWFAFIVLILSIIINIIILGFGPKIINFANRYFDAHFYSQDTSKDAFYYHGIIKTRLEYLFDKISFLNPSFIFIILPIILIPILLLVLYQKQKLLIGKFRILAVIIIVLNLTLIWQGLHRPIPENIINTLSGSKVVQFFQEQISQGHLFRIYRLGSLFDGFLYKFDKLRIDRVPSGEFKLATLIPISNVLFGIDAIDAPYENFKTKRQFRITSIIGCNSSNDLCGNNPNEIEKQLNYFQSGQESKLLSMLNVKYIITPYEFSAPWKKALETTVKEKETGVSVPVYVYENPDVLPRIYFANKVKFIESDDEEGVFKRLLEVENFKENTLIECSDCPGQELNVINDDTKIDIEEIKDGYLKIKTKTSSPRWLIYSESNLPTWEVRINGNLTKIYTANYLFQAIYVLRGENEIEFKYPGLWKQFLYSLRRLTKSR